MTEAASPCCCMCCLSRVDVCVMPDDSLHCFTNYQVAMYRTDQGFQGLGYLATHACQMVGTLRRLRPGR